MNRSLRNPWFLLACGFLVVNLYGVLRLSREPAPPGASPEAPAPREHMIPESSPILLRHVVQADQHEDGRVVLAVIFDRDVSPAVLQRFLRITGPDGAPRPAEALDDGASQRIAVAVEAEPGEALNVAVRAGFYAESGPERVEQELVRGIVLESDIALTMVDVRSPPFESPSVVLSFSRPVDIVSLRQSLRLDPAAEVMITERSDWRYGRAYYLAGNLQPGRHYTLSVDPGLRADAAKIRMRNPIEQDVFLPDAPPAIRIPVEGRFLSPHGNLLLPLESVNIGAFRVQAARLPAHNLVQYAMREGRRYRHHWGDPADGITVPEADRSFTLEAPANSHVVHHVALRDLLPAGRATGAWQIRIGTGDVVRDRRLLVVSDIGITVRHAPGELLVWANSIHDLAPVAGAQVQVWSEAAECLLEGTTDAQGLARLEPGADAEPFMVTVRRDDDLAFISLREALVGQAGPGSDPAYLREGLEAFVYTDRGVYRPGETAHARAVVRGPDMRLAEPLPVVLHVFRPDDREHSRMPAMLSAYGTAVFAVPLAGFDATGRYRLELRTPGAEEPLGSAVIAVEDFVPPRLAVALQPVVSPTAPEGEVALAARYLYGAPAARNRFQVTLHAVPKPFEPAAFPDYAFGDPGRPAQTVTHALHAGHLDAGGMARLSFVVPDPVRPPAMIEAVLTATVHEQGGRTVSAAAREPMHVYPYYIGIHRPDLDGLQPMRPAAVALQLVAPDGGPHRAATALSVTLEQVEWSTVYRRDSRGRYRLESDRRVTPLRTATVETDAGGVARYQFTPAVTGRLQLRVEAADGPSTVLDFPVGRDGWEDRSLERLDRVELAWDRETYRPGETAALTVVAPFPGRALLTVEQDRVLHHEIRTLDGNRATFQIPVTADCFPNAHASVHVIRALPPGDAAAGRQAARAIGTIPLRLDTQSRRLQVAIEVPATGRPGEPLELALEVRNPDGSPAVAEVAIAVVDEAICMLTDFQIPDPAGHFLALRRLSFQASDLYAMLLPESDPDTARYHAHTGGDVASLLRGRLNPVRSRRFRPLALWQAELETDRQGRATARFAIPEFSGQVRVMAVAVSRERAGSATQAVTINRPFSVLASLPRFMATGDRGVLAVELHHAGKEPVVADLAVETDGPVAIPGPGSRSVRLEPGSRHALELPIEAGDRSGLARIHIRAAAGDERVTDTIELPVRAPAAFQSRWTDLAIEPGEAATFTPSSDWRTGSASLDFRVNPLPAIGLGGALDYLLGYPYGCLEQTLSAAFPVLDLIDLPAVGGARRIVADPEGHTRQTINRVLAMQTANGGFGWWPHDTRPYDWGSVYAMHYLAAARDAGIAPPAAPFEAGLQFLRGLLARSVPPAARTRADVWREDAALRAYACYVLARAGQPHHGWAERLREQLDRLDLDSRLYLVKALAAGGRRRDALAVLESLDDLPLPESAADGGGLPSPARAEAMHLAAWVEMDPAHPSIPGRVDTLLAMRDDGRWRTTQENAAAFRALARVLAHNRDAAVPGHGVLVQAGRELAFDNDTGPIALHPGEPVTIRNRGGGRLYATLAERGIPEAVEADADRGIRVRRQYLAIDQTPVDPARLRQGDLVVVQLEIDTLGRTRDNLVIEDLLPAGLEIENPNLKTAEFVHWAQRETNLPLRHLDARDDRLVLFAAPVTGIRRFHYTVRAVTPGAYTRPPVTLEGMYSPELRSTHHGGRLAIAEAAP